MSEQRRAKIDLRMSEADWDALERLVPAVQERVGPGIGVGASDAIRWAIHTCDVLLQREALAESEGG